MIIAMTIRIESSDDFDEVIQKIDVDDTIDVLTKHFLESMRVSRISAEAHAVDAREVYTNGKVRIVDISPLREHSVEV